MDPDDERVLISSKTLKELISCRLCKGYITDATVVYECGHAFCRRCIIEYVMAHNKCPRCLDLTACSQIIETDQLKADLQMDAIIRELVSHLVKEQHRRERASLGISNLTTEQRTLRTDDASQMTAKLSRVNGDEQLVARFVACPANTTIGQLKKAIAGQLAPGDVEEQGRIKIEILHKATTLADDLTMYALLMHGFKKKNLGPMPLGYTLEKM